MMISWNRFPEYTPLPKTLYAGKPEKPLTVCSDEVGVQGEEAQTQRDKA